jgi:hypothetical protein
VAFRFTIPATLVVGDEVRLTVTAEDDTVLFTSVLGRIAEAASPDGPRAPVGEEASQEPTGGGGEVVRGAPDASKDDAGQQPPALQRTGGPLGGLVVLAFALLASGVLALRTRSPRRETAAAHRRTGPA